ncbi:unnamed protein product, partial [Didymodactylos carnosus]
MKLPGDCPLAPLSM